MNALDLDPAERQVCEVWTRVMGYHRPVSEFNPGKRAEHEERLHFTIDEAAIYEGVDELAVGEQAVAEGRLSREEVEHGLDEVYDVWAEEDCDDD